MKYSKPTFEKIELETKDIVSASATESGEGSITVNHITITGPKDEFFASFGDLVRG